MLIENSILAGKILLILENVTGSVRIVDIETIMESSIQETNLAISKLLSEGLVELIRENERSAIIVTKNPKKHTDNYFKDTMIEHLASIEQS